MPEHKSPNIIFIFADDLGYGDVSCCNPDGQIPTPNIDRIASNGMMFTDAHATSAVCTPSRYGVLTGRYNWRSRLQSGIVGVFEEPLIREDIPTWPGFLQNNGYQTACIGKWHLGWDWAIEDPEQFQPAEANPSPAIDEATKAKWKEIFTRPISGGPVDRGFDHYFGDDIPNWPPYGWVEDDHMLEPPSEYLPLDKLRQGDGTNTDFGRCKNDMDLASRPGPAVEGWSFEPILPTLQQHVCEYIRDQASSSDPFFLYLPLTSPHTPLAVNDEWKGASGLNLYADFVMETDAVIGKVLDALEETGAMKDTLVIFASDNGCAPYIGVRDLEDQGHYPSAQFRGYKADVWDGGHRIPFMASWAGHISPGSVCDQQVCLSDLMATTADILNTDLADDAGPDSFSLLELFQGAGHPIRNEVVHHSITGQFAIRHQQWKLVLCPGSGGWCPPTDSEAEEQNMPPVQLYDMDADPGETTNLQAKHPEVVEDLTHHLQNLVDRGRSTPGPELENEVPVDIHKR